MKEIEFSSFRDSTAKVYYENDEVFREFDISRQKDLDHLLNSGLAERLISDNFLIPFEIILKTETKIILRVEKLEFITYPYEWSFSMLKEAALLFLDLQLIALKHGMILKDSTAYNIQFQNNKPIFIDLGSFELYNGSSLWQGYHQFCTHFIAPLALISQCDPTLSNLLRLHIDGIPLKLASKLLPIKSYFNNLCLIHIHIHSRFINKSTHKNKTHSQFQNSKIQEIIAHLHESISSLYLRGVQTEWSNYYDDDVDKDYLENKKKLISSIFKNKKQVGIVWDLGANTGEFSLLAANYCNFVLSTDIDPLAVDKLYFHIKKYKVDNIIGLIMDICNPPGGVGWENKERKGLLSRIRPNTILALAVVHHLRITNGINIEYLVDFFANNCSQLILEYIPKSDPKVKKILQNREDVFDDYEYEEFMKSFEIKFTIEEIVTIVPSERKLICLMNKSNRLHE